MQKKIVSKTKLTKEDVDERLAQMEKSQELADITRDMKSAGATTTVTTTGEVQLENLAGAGITEDKLYEQMLEEYRSMLEKIGEFAFSDFMKKRYFKNGKMKSLVRILEKASMALVSRSLMDIFRTRVKQRNGGKLPTVKEKTGLFGKTTDRVMKPEEIVAKYEVEVDLPPDEDRPLTVTGT